jgi:hypothetical protein
MDVSGRIPKTWMPAIHAGMTISAVSCGHNHFATTGAKRLLTSEATIHYGNPYLA